MKRIRSIWRTAICIIAIVATCLLVNSCGTKKIGQLIIEDLASGFISTPDSARPQTWWHWREGRINKEAITAELEAMKRIGLGGVTMFSSSRMGEAGQNVLCLTPEWHERVTFALQECDRLGLTFNFQNCAGWSGSGGPWITPDKNMMHVVYEKKSLDGGSNVRMEAPPSWPEKGDKFYRDIAVLAFPTPSAFKDLTALPLPAVTSNFIEGDPGRLNVPENKIPDVKEVPVQVIDAGKPAWVQFEFPSAVTCHSVTIAGASERNMPEEHRAVVQASDDGREFHDVVRLATYYTSFHRADAPDIHAIPETRTRFFRLSWQGPVKLVLRQVNWSSEPVISSLESKSGEFGRTFVSEPVLPDESGKVVPPDQILDLTCHLDAKGTLSWTAPFGGSWTVVRIGYRNTGKKNAPAAPEVTGLECDKFNPEAIAFHFDHYAREIIRDAAFANSKNLTGITFDSWEATSQNWSPVFREEFRKRRGYDVMTCLPVFAGFMVGDRDLTDRFLRDVRQTMSDLISETFFDTMRELANKYGLKVSSEAVGSDGAGTMVCDPAQPYLHVDIPMNEFGDQLKIASSAAHLMGKPVVALEAFTQGRANWQNCPSSMKARGDFAFCQGVTRFVFHTYAHNPDIDKINPGPAFGPYGIPLSRGQTWWKMGKEWMAYISRCQFMLQQGKASADVLYFYGEEPAGPIRPSMEDQGFPRGYDYDLLPPETLIKDLSFRNGSLTMPVGTTYKVLVLRNSDHMTPEAAEKIMKLVYAGATVLGPRPKRSPSLRNYPQCDKIVEKIGKEVWDNCDGKTITQHAYGKGRVFWGITLKEVLDAISLPPDFSVDGAGEGTDLQFIHRKEGETDIYFVSNVADSMYMAGSIGEHWNPVSHAVDFTAGFRVTGKKPEIWDPVTGSIKDALSFRQENGRTFLPLHLDSHASLFVIFSKPIPADGKGIAERNDPELHQKLLMEGPWKVKFTPGWGAPGSVEFKKLEDWSKRPENAIKYYSGTANYSISFDWERPLSTAVFLDLGRVEVIAGVRLNDKDCGIVWTPPYRVDITKALKAGRNDIEIRVANTWLNRLMGDGLGIKMGSEKRTWTTCNPFTVDPELTVPEISTRSMLYYKDLKREPVPSGLIGPVRILEQ